jgi:hypothetical protein
MRKLIEAIARTLGVKDFSVDVSTAVRGIVYNSESKTVMLKPEATTMSGEECISIKALAHEVYHHYQNVNGLLPEDGSKEHKEYVRFRKKQYREFCPQFSWTYLTFRWEGTAEAFARVFLEQHYCFLNKIGDISDEDLAESLSETAKIGHPKNYLPRHLEVVEIFKKEFEEVVINMRAKYAERIDAILTAIADEELYQEDYSFRVIS